jgi:capsule polysaccharide modification protein KpsS
VFLKYVPEDDPVWLKLAAEINTRDSIVVFMALFFFNVKYVVTFFFLSKLYTGYWLAGMFSYVLSSVLWFSMWGKVEMRQVVCANLYCTNDQYG